MCVEAVREPVQNITGRLQYDASSSANYLGTAVNFHTSGSDGWQGNEPKTKRGINYADMWSPQSWSGRPFPCIGLTFTERDHQGCDKYWWWTVRVAHTSISHWVLNNWYLTFNTAFSKTGIGDYIFVHRIYSHVCQWRGNMSSLWLCWQVHWSVIVTQRSHVTVSRCDVGHAC